MSVGCVSRDSSFRWWWAPRHYMLTCFAHFITFSVSVGHLILLSSATNSFWFWLSGPGWRLQNLLSQNRYSLQKATVGRILHPCVFPEVSLGIFYEGFLFSRYSDLVLLLHYCHYCGPGSVVGIATGYRMVRRSNPGGGEIFHTCPDPPWGPPSLLYNGYRVFPGGKERPRRYADPSTLLVPWSRRSIAIRLLPLWAVRPVQSLSACTRVHFTFAFYSTNLGALINL